MPLTPPAGLQPADAVAWAVTAAAIRLGDAYAGKHGIDHVAARPGRVVVYCYHLGAANDHVAAVRRLAGPGVPVEFVPFVRPETKKRFARR